MAAGLSSRSEGGHQGGVDRELGTIPQTGEIGDHLNAFFCFLWLLPVDVSSGPGTDAARVLRPQGQAAPSLGGSVVEDAVERRACSGLLLQRL